jgi:glycosyltransferase involved in cell wall biosynthesis
LKKVITVDCRLIFSSGIGTYISNILPFIIDYFNDIQFVLLGNEKRLSKLYKNNFNNIKIVNFNSPIYSIKEQMMFPKLIPSETSLFWSPHYNFPIFYTGKLIINVHDLCHLAIKQKVYSFIKILYSKLMFNLIKFRANSIIYISEFTKTQFNKIVGKPKCNEFITLLAVNKSWFKLSQTHNEIKEPYILYVGNVKPHKNLSRLIKAFEIIANKINHKILIVGKKDGFISGDDSLTTMVQKFNKRVFFTGEVSDSKLKNLFINSDIFVFPSIYEGFGLPPLEAMACGVPVVASKIASIPEVCGDAALYFDPFDVNDISEKILLMIKDNNLKKEYIKKGTLQVQKYSWEKTADNTIKIIKKILKRS